MTAAVYETHIEAFPCRRGKVRDVYDLGDELLIVATDRISAFDVVLPTPIPGKGRLLTHLSAFWFRRLEGRVAHHLLGVVEEAEHLPESLRAHADVLVGRTMRCRKAQVVPIECVVRGYLAGSGWKEYCRTGRVCGVALPAGLRQAERLPEPIFTPATKAETGHDENISFEAACEVAGAEVMARLREWSVSLYVEAARYAESRGIILADTKLEWGWCDGRLILVDEVFTPDSSRFWPADAYAPGTDPPSFDKQYVRNYLEGLCASGRWDRRPPGPPLPPEVVETTAQKYREACVRLTGTAP